MLLGVIKKILDNFLKIDKIKAANLKIDFSVKINIKSQD